MRKFTWRHRGPLLAAVTAALLLGLASTAYGLLRARRNHQRAEAALAEAQTISEALALDRKLHGNNYRNVPRNMSNLACVRQQRGDLKGAEALWLEALRIQREFLPKDHQDPAWTLRLLAELKYQAGDFARSEQFCREASDKVLGPRSRSRRPPPTVFAPAGIFTDSADVVLTSLAQPLIGPSVVTVKNPAKYLAGFSFWVAFPSILIGAAYASQAPHFRRCASRKCCFRHVPRSLSGKWATQYTGQTSGRARS